MNLFFDDRKLAPVASVDSQASSSAAANCPAVPPLSPSVLRHSPGVRDSRRVAGDPVVASKMRSVTGRLTLRSSWVAALMSLAGWRPLTSPLEGISSVRVARMDLCASCGRTA